LSATARSNVPRSRKNAVCRTLGDERTQSDALNLLARLATALTSTPEEQQP
jgi:hypothetical protein